jgi:hypothetical protein
MAFVEGVSLIYKCSSSVFGIASGSDVARVRINFEPGPVLVDYRIRLYIQLGENQIQIGQIWEGGTEPTEVDIPLYFNAHELSIPTGQYEVLREAASTVGVPGDDWQGSTGLILSIDADTTPSFLGPYVGSDDCGPPVTFQVSTEIHHAESWSYQLYDGETPISGGSPGAGTHELDGCSGYAHVTDIPSNATRITFTATNGNGSLTVSSNLALPIPSVSIEADPPSIFEEQETTLNWSAIHASTVQIDNGIGVVGIEANPWLNELSGSVKVSPMETTTYTITAFGFCQEATSQVTVTVTPPPTRHYLKPDPGRGTAWSLVPEPCD